MYYNQTLISSEHCIINVMDYD